MSKEPQDNQTPDDDAGLYVISVAAELSGLHPQTLRQYDRLGLVSPNRTVGRNRRYSLRDIASLRMVGRLVGEGINHAGIKRIIELESAMANMAIEVAQLRIEVDALLKENLPLLLKIKENHLHFLQEKPRSMKIWIGERKLMFLVSLLKVKVELMKMMKLYMMI
jgi:MerR family transcriptional regulator/heat shock protein HspR